MLVRLKANIDIVFQKLFGVEKNKYSLKSLINSIVEEDEQIRSLELVEPYREPVYLKKKRSPLKVIAIGERGQKYKIDINVGPTRREVDLMIREWANTYLHHVVDRTFYANDEYKTLIINIMNYEHFDDYGIGRYHRRSTHRDSKTNERFFDFDASAVHFVELPKYDRCRDGVNTSLQQWMTFLKESDEITPDNITLEVYSQYIDPVVTHINEMYLSREERVVYGEQLFEYFRIFV